MKQPWQVLAKVFRETIRTKKCGDLTKQHPIFFYLLGKHKSWLAIENKRWYYFLNIILFINDCFSIIQIIGQVISQTLSSHHKLVWYIFFKVFSFSERPYCPLPKRTTNQDQAFQFRLDQRLPEKPKTVNFEKDISNKKYVISHHQKQIQTWLTTHFPPHAYPVRMHTIKWLEKVIKRVDLLKYEGCSCF